MKYDLVVPVLDNVPLTPGFKRLTLEAPPVAAALAPGQFVQVRINPGAALPLLRRPFAPSGVHPDGRLEMVYAIVGEGTALLAAKRPGDTVGLLGPLGNGYAPPKTAGAPAILAGGGCGAPGLKPWLAFLKKNGHRVGVALGVRHAAGLLELDAWRDAGADDLLLATDDGSAGRRGHAVAAAADLLARPAYAVPGATLYGCGPSPMLAGLARLAGERGLDCQVSLEERMACGFGACVGCVVATRAGGSDGDAAAVYEKVCQSGPVFDAARLEW